MSGSFIRAENKDENTDKGKELPATEIRHAVVLP